MPILSILIAFPVVCALIIGFAAPQKGARGVAVLSGVVTLALSLLLLTMVPSAVPAPGAALSTAEAARQFGALEQYRWLPEFGISYTVGVDGVSMWLVVLTCFLTVFAALAPKNSPVEGRDKEFYVWLCLLQAALIGSFAALDLILFYVFFEASLVPMYFLIGIWGGTARRVNAAVKFFLYTLVGSLVMLVGLIAVYLHGRTALSGAGTFDYLTLKSALVAQPLPVALSAACFGAFALAFAIKTPVFPFHTWQADAYAEAPTPAVILMAAVLSKLGTYGFYRFCIPLFPDAARAAGPYLVALGAIGIVYGALVAAMQRDLKRLIAYSSVSHLGFVVAGLFAFTPQSVTGATTQMLNHGVSTGALFLLIGMLESRRGTRNIRAFGGLWEQMPLFGRVFLIVLLSSIALPLTNGFVGEFLILLGLFQTHPFWGAVATSGVIWSAVYMLWMFQRVMYGPVAKIENRRLLDLTWGERAVLAPFVVLIFVQGILPTLFTRYLAPSVDNALRDAVPGRPTVAYREVAGLPPAGGTGEVPAPAEEAPQPAAP
jgi:NADH-quinone oxidoreductase subunit M